MSLKGLIFFLLGIISFSVTMSAGPEELRHVSEMRSGLDIVEDLIPDDIDEDEIHDNNKSDGYDDDIERNWNMILLGYL